MKIQLIRSATLRLTYAGRTYLIDPWLAAKGTGNSYAGTHRSPLVDLPMSIEEIISGIDTVIVSHLHSDHFDAAAWDALPKDVPLICAERDAGAIAGRGFTNITGMSSTLEDGPVHIALTGGRHGPPEVLADMGEVSGFVFKASGEPTLYWAGDTIVCEEVREAIASAQPDVIVVHSGAAMWKGNGPIVMDDVMVAQTLRLAPKATVIATHLDTVDHGTISREALRAAIAREADIAPRLRIPADGETMAFEE